MKPSDLEYIVELVTQRVLEAVNAKGPEESPQVEGLPKILLVGEPGRELPEEWSENAVVYDMEDYRRHRNILRYDRIVITALTITQLADIAQGRIGDETSCAVIHALLQGVDTLMLDNALPFRSFAGKGSAALYHLLESYAQTLRVFGVKPADQKPQQTLPAAKPPKYMAPPLTAPKGSAAPNAGRVVTEADALLLTGKEREVHLPANAILTPSARDVFAQTRARLVWDCE